MSKIRFDRALSVGLAHPVRQLVDARRGTTRIPILMYHGVRSKLDGRSPYYETSTTPELFANQMRFLRENNYTAVDLHEAVEAIVVGRNHRKCVAITFDDGYRDFYTHALPPLLENRFKATMFIVSGLTGNEPISRGDREYLCWNEVREMRARGIRIGSHTVSHPELHRLTPKELEYEIRQSKENIEDGLGELVTSFSYPYAFPEHDKKFVERLKDLLQTHGYENGVSTILGRAGSSHDWYSLPRIPVNSHDDLLFFRAKIEGGYDWLHPAQRAYKTLFKRCEASSDRPGLALNP